MTKTGEHPRVEDLRGLSVFSDLADEQLAWLASQMELLQLYTGDVLFQAGDVAEHMIVFFCGELRAERTDGRVYIPPTGQATGLLPYSHMTEFPSTVRATMGTRVGLLHKDHFPEMLDRIPILRERLVSALSSRIREDATDQQQQEKLAALGKLSAGLAHEINNPAAAARRAADNLRQSISVTRAADLDLDTRGLPAAARLFMTRLEAKWAGKELAVSAMDSLDRSEREESVADWLDSHNVEAAWELAPTLVDAGCFEDTLTEIGVQVPAGFLSTAITRLNASFTTTRLIGEIESSIGRVSELVRAVKEYSYMDQAPQQEVDIHEGIESTLVMLRHKMKNGVELIREYDRGIPKVFVHGSELNQVWTNLFSNAVEAMHEKGTLRIRTSRDATHLVTEVIDNGPGIPANIKTRIFEPFFTTKGVGEGSGLGLDIVRRIIKKHSGDITVNSRPGETRFVVRIPLIQPGEVKT
jgi:signal transduction histidine kinase